MLYSRIQKEHARLEEQMQELQRKLEKLPEGKLICCKDGKGYRWYQSDGHKKVYLYKKQRDLAEKLALRKYYQVLLDEVRHEKRALEFYLDHHCDLPQKARKLLEEHPGYQELLDGYFLPEVDEYREWMMADYDRNTNYPEYLIHKTAVAGMVRSKSEAMIAHFLYSNQIPFRYECALHLSEATIYPDFTIRHPVTGEIYYWEHFGRMDDAGYAKNVASKLQLYISNGIVPTIRLITTYETWEDPLTIEKIENILRQYFLE